MKKLVKSNRSKIISAPMQMVLILFLSVLYLTGFSQTYPPSCVVVQPYSNEYFKAGSDIEIRVYSTDIGKSQNNGTVTLVEFFADGEKIGEATSPEGDYYFVYEWNCVPQGTYRLTAKATNSRGVTFTSVGNIITVGTKDVPENGMSSGKGKYLANIISSTPNHNYAGYWNGVTAENACKWGPVEGSRDNFNWGGADNVYKYAKNNNMMFRYHAAVWASQYPGWLADQYGGKVSTADARAEAVEYMEAIATRFPLADQVDVLNEQLGTHQRDNQVFRDLFSGIKNCPQDNFTYQIWLFEEARRIFPNTKLVLNDYGIVNDPNAIRQQQKLITALRDRGLIDGFGAQSHLFSVDGMRAGQLTSNLTLMAESGVPIYITELDMNGGNEDDYANESAQEQSFKTHFPEFWEHPAVAGVTFWGYISNATWIDGSGFVRGTTEKPAMKWLKNYMSGQSDVGYPTAQVPQGNCCSTPAPAVPETTVSYEIGATAAQLSATGTALKWYDSSGKLLTSAPTPSTSTVGKTSYYVSQTSGCESQKTRITVVVYQPQGPYGGTAHAIPGKIELEHFDVGGQDSAYFDVDAGTNVDPAPDFRTDEDVDLEVCKDDGGGYNLGWTAAGEWLEYTVDVANAGSYDIIIRASANGDDKTVSLTSDGAVLAADVPITNTLGWQDWTDITISDVELKAGKQVLRLTIGDSDFVNLNYMTFVYNDIPVEPIQLKTGWNLIGCPLEGSTEISAALSSIWDKVECVKDMDSFYMKEQADVFNLLQSLEWGRGYLVKVDADCELEW